MFFGLAYGVCAFISIWLALKECIFLDFGSLINMRFTPFGSLIIYEFLVSWLAKYHVILDVLARLQVMELYICWLARIL